MEPPEELCRRRLVLPEGRVRIILDTDTYNEVDDQFALCQAVLSHERIQLLGVHADRFSMRVPAVPGTAWRRATRRFSASLTCLERVPGA